MEDALLLHRLQFAFTATYHYLFPQLTMGLALLIVILKWVSLRTGKEIYNTGARFWGKIFAINFAVGVVTGIPMEFEFGTNWARFSTYAGGVIGQTLAMEGVFAFFLESSFLGLFLFGEKRLGSKLHFLSAFLVFLGSWISGYFIIVTNAWMQHPVGYAAGPNGTLMLSSFADLLLNPWALWQYLHNMTGAVVTGSFCVASTGAYYLLARRDEEYGKIFVRTGVIAGLISSLLLAFPTGDAQGKNVAHSQPAALAAMEGLFRTENGAPLVLIGQPDMEKKRLDNPLHVPEMLSFLTYNRGGPKSKGLTHSPRTRGRQTFLSSITAITSWWGWGRYSYLSPRRGAGSSGGRGRTRRERSSGLLCSHSPSRSSPTRPDGSRQNSEGSRGSSTDSSGRRRERRRRSRRGTRSSRSSDSSACTSSSGCFFSSL